MSHPPDRIPVLLLKTKSTPVDTYNEYFSNEPFAPTFVPVLEHRLNIRNLEFVRSLLLDGKLGREHNAKYGGIIFTSQRAVEGFAKAVDQAEADSSSLRSPLKFTYNPDAHGLRRNATDSSSATPLPLYVVGPATYRTLTSVLLTSSNSRDSVLAPLSPQIFGSHTGNGEALAQFILEHYHALPGPNHTLPLLLLVGEQRRDVIPKTLMDPTLAGAKQIHVDELVVYETGVMESFTQDFALHISQLESDARHGVVVVVVFSPSGCEALLRCLGYIDDGKKLTEKGRSRADGKKNVPSQAEEGTRYIIATIGPTTRDYLEREFGFKADICAEKPSPEGVGEGVKKFLAERSHVRKVAVE